jgi:hypothetical protein
VVNRDGSLNAEGNDIEKTSDSFPAWYLLQESAEMLVTGNLQPGEVSSDFHWQLPINFHNPQQSAKREKENNDGFSTLYNSN